MSALLVAHLAGVVPGGGARVQLVGPEARAVPVVVAGPRALGRAGVAQARHPVDQGAGQLAVVARR